MTAELPKSRCLPLGIGSGSTPETSEPCARLPSSTIDGWVPGRSRSEWETWRIALRSQLSSMSTPFSTSRCFDHTERILFLVESSRRPHLLRPAKAQSTRWSKSSTRAGAGGTSSTTYGGRVIPTLTTTPGSQGPTWKTAKTSSMSTTLSTRPPPPPLSMHLPTPPDAADVWWPRLRRELCLRPRGGILSRMP